MTRIIKHVAVIGAGTMGGGIAAHFANAGYQVDLLDVPGSGQDRMQVVKSGWERVKKAKPAALFTPDMADRRGLGVCVDHQWPPPSHFAAAAGRHGR